MLALKPLTTQCLWHASRRSSRSQSRCLQWTRSGAHKTERAPNPRQPTRLLDEPAPDQRWKATGRKRLREISASGTRPQHRSLLEELKPDEIQRAAEGKGRKNGEARKPPTPQLSLLEELFPDEVCKIENNISNDPGKEQELPRIPLPEVDELFGDLHDDLELSRRRPRLVTKDAAADAFRRQQLAVVTLQIASKSLVESDFRRIAPKGRHIDEWTGPGDILKGA